jgi:hypothetical protein
MDRKKPERFWHCLFAEESKTPEMPTGFGNHGKLHPLKMIPYAGLAEVALPTPNFLGSAHQRNGFAPPALFT